MSNAQNGDNRLLWAIGIFGALALGILGMVLFVSLRQPIAADGVSQAQATPSSSQQQDTTNESPTPADGLPAPANGNATATLAPGASPASPDAAGSEGGAAAAPNASPASEQTAAPGSGGPTSTSATATDQPEATATPVEVFVFTGSGTGLTNPVDVPQGMYRVLFSSTEPLQSLTPVTLEGDCDEITLLSGESGQLDLSATYRSLGCRVQFDIEGNGEWTLTLEKVGHNGTIDVPIQLSGSGPETTRLVNLPAGDYTISLTTDSPVSMVIVIVAEGTCFERPMLVNPSPGTFTVPYASTGCKVIFQVNNVTASWNLSVVAGD